MSARMTAGLVAMVALSAPARGEACTCIPPLSWVTPGPLDSVPPNAHLFVTVDAQPTLCDDKGHCASRKLSIALRRAAHDSVPAMLVGTHVVHETPMGNFVHYELAPDALLSAKTRYDVLLVDAHGTTPARIISTFVTTSSPDNVPPEWPATIEDASLEHPSSFFSCGEGDMMTIRIPAANDASPVRWEVFVAPGDVPIDWSKAPNGVVIPKFVNPVKLFFDIGATACGPSVPLPKAKSVRLGIRPIDVAGNVGREAEIVRAWPPPPPPKKP